MAYVGENFPAPREPGTSLGEVPGATSSDFLTQLIDLLRKIAPWVLGALILYFVLKKMGVLGKLTNGSSKRVKTWRSIPEWRPGADTSLRRDALKREVARIGYGPTIKRLVGYANLSGNKNASADASWLRSEFGS